jgi:uncharacterized repeat protein (TIGR03803 family)
MLRIGQVYGTTTAGGTFNEGTVFQLTFSSEGWNYSVLYNFTSEYDGHPYSRVAVGPDGNLYGTLGVDLSCGSAYQVTPSGYKTNIHTFSGPDGYIPYEPVVQVWMPARNN